jgi:hypothetical protein
VSSPSPPLDPREGRQNALVLFLRVLFVALIVVTLLALVLPGDAGDTAGEVMVALLIIAPVSRVLWMLVRWTRKGDLRFSLAAAALLLVMASGLLLGR